MNEESNIDKFREELEPYKNTLVIMNFEVVNIIDVVEDDDDCYWVVDNANVTNLVSCVIGWIPLKNKIDDYQKLVNKWNLFSTIKTQ